MSQAVARIHRLHDVQLTQEEYGASPNDSQNAAVLAAGEAGLSVECGWKNLAIGEQVRRNTEVESLDKWNCVRCSRAEMWDLPWSIVVVEHCCSVFRL